MSAKYLAGLAAICGLVIAGLDYHQQHKKSEGGLSLESYLNSVSSRVFGDEVIAAETRAFLPDAPDGWSRRALAEGDNAPLWTGTSGPEATQAAARGWIYAKDDEIIWIEAFRNDLLKSKGVLSGMAEVSASEIAYQQEYEGFAVSGGVGFAEMEFPSWQEASAFRVFDGWIGFDDEIQIRVRAVASDASVRALLGAINYDGLNEILNTPVPTVGTDVQVQPENEVALAAQMMVLRTAMVQLRAESAKERNLNSDEAAQLINSFVENIAPGATLDATGDDVPDYDALIQTTYRSALILIMENDRSQQAPATEGGKLTCKTVGTRKLCRSDD
ncbi:hypothetical protein [uncultured Ruegeria sp.]|uniref:hypothetical protein n=1 Tax=uncultured Ruegeria sp. TaxID=259304 RepID=UPI002623D94A|nr:hypothetical protein [uncultured Ruegeria sp.]